jgi:hypothetical protein
MNIFFVYLFTPVSANKTFNSSVQQVINCVEIPRAFSQGLLRHANNLSSSCARGLNLHMMKERLHDVLIHKNNIILCGGREYFCLFFERTKSAWNCIK